MEEKRHKILQSAVNTVSRYGIRRTSMDDIAKDAGISRPAIYQYFKNKDAVAQAALEMVVAQALEKAEQAAATDDSPRQKLIAYLTTYMSFYYRLLFSGPHVAELMEIKRQSGSEKPKLARLQVIAKINAIMNLNPNAEAGHILVSSAEGLKMAAPDEETLVKRIEVLVLQFFT